MKASYYNLSYIYEDYYVLLNTKTKNIIRFPREYQKLIDDILDKTAIVDNKELMEILAREKFLIPDNINELDDLHRQCYELVNSETLYLTIMPTYTCNLACVYCFQHHIPGAIMNATTVKSIELAVAKKISKYKALYVEWFGGEPLVARQQVISLNKKFKEICKEAKIPYAARITTNGYVLDINTFEQLFKSNCFVYYISLDGGKGLHDKQRPCKNGTGSYEVIINNLLQIKNHIKSKNFRVEIRVNCTGASYDEFEGFLSNFEKKFGADNRFSLIIETVNDWSDRTESMKKDGQILKRSDLNKFAIEAHKYNINLANADKHLLDTEICQAAKRNAYSIFYDGTIQKCQMALESKEFCKSNIIGRVTEEGEFAIEENVESLWVNDSIPKACEDCKLLPLCFGKKCVYLKEIQGQECNEMEKDFLNSFLVYDTSKLDNIPLFTIND